ncbi:MAG: Calx-beta domain-containing protein, partial [Marinicella sp.]
MKNNAKQITLICILMLGISDVFAKLSQPDYILYGTATWFGAPLANETEITIYLNNQLVTVSKYAMGSDENLNDLYALRVPMDSNDPRVFGHARPGDPASIFINGSLVADVLIGDYGVAERLDIDPSNLAGGSSVLAILAGEVSEGNAGQTMLPMQITLSNSADAIVSVDWENTDGSAIGGDDCSFDVDYINSSGTAEIAIGDTETIIEIPVCGDTMIESSETFEIVISNSQNAIIQFDRATGTILDDDGLPELRVFDAVIFEPASGSLIHEFELKLSRAYDQVVSVNYTTVAGSATEGVDYLATSGTLTIPIGTTSAVIPLTVFSDGEPESIETMTVALSSPVNAQLVSTQIQAFIIEALTRLGPELW